MYVINIINDFWETEIYISNSVLSEIGMVPSTYEEKITVRECFEKKKMRKIWQKWEHRPLSRVGTSQNIDSNIQYVHMIFANLCRRQKFMKFTITTEKVTWQYSDSKQASKKILETLPKFIDFQF